MAQTAPHKKPVFVLCPGGITTGGPELLHQLVDLLNREGREASIVYLPFRKHHRTPQAYMRYNAPQANRKSIGPGSIVVMPEVYGSLIPHFRLQEVYFWWLSVDNFFVAEGNTNVGRILPPSIRNRRAIERARQGVALHLYQSEYARSFLEAQHLEPMVRLSDYIAPEFSKLPTGAVARENIVVYNPAKGRHRTKLVLRELARMAGDTVTCSPIVGMSRDELRNVLDRAKVYIDFGEHPGMDRIPREAAARGCCIISNRRGSAGNAEDVPIPDEYKIEDTKPGFARTAASLVAEICGDFAEHSHQFDAYRQVISHQEAEFCRDALKVFSR